MFFFGKLTTKQKVTFCLAVLGILVNYWVCACMVYTFFHTYPFTNEELRMLLTINVLTFAIFSQMLLIAFFRKF